MLVIDRTVTAVKPTLNDHDVLEFCKNGFLALKGVIPQSTNDWVFEQLDRDDGHETDLADSERFVNEVFLNPAVTGVIRSVLGDNFLFPEQVHNHRLAGPKKPLPWHIDAGARFDRTCDLVYAFYVPQTNTKEGGATYFLPGSHLVPITREELQHFGHLAGQVQTVAPAGSVFIVHSSIWHRQALKTDPGTRNLVRWSYWRSEPPRQGLDRRSRVRHRYSRLCDRQRVLYHRDPQVAVCAACCRNVHVAMRQIGSFPLAWRKRLAIQSLAEHAFWTEKGGRITGADARRGAGENRHARLVGK